MTKYDVKPEKRGMYILTEMARLSLNGDVFFYEEDLFRACQRARRNLDYATFHSDLVTLQQARKVRPEGRRLYLDWQLCYENAAAQCLAGILPATKLPVAPLPEYLSVGDIVLTAEQRKAVQFALSHRLSLLLGSAGTGKTTLIQAILDNQPRGGFVLCAPTGKAARNLADRTGYKARTVHGALGMVPDEFFLQPVIWRNVRLVVIDEASMVTLEMLAGILSRVPFDCRIVLVGDPYQLESVGAGNILSDLLALGSPVIHLQQIHRQADAQRGLMHNVTHFHELDHCAQLIQDESFMLKQINDESVAAALCAEAVRRYLTGESIQVLSPYNSATALSVHALNLAIRAQVNPPTRDKRFLQSRLGNRFYDGDRVMILRNDRDQNCCNGDIGILHILSAKEDSLDFAVFLPDGRCPRWQRDSAIEQLSLAYAITVHKAQGSEYDTVLMPMTRCIIGMLTRNLLYTAITRAKKHVLLFGSEDAVDIAMQQMPRNRHSMLVTKTRMTMSKSA